MDQLKLYRVSVEYELVVAAVDELQAEEKAIDAIRDDDGGLGFPMIWTDPLETKDGLPWGCSVDALPYGVRDGKNPNKTIEEYLIEREKEV